MRKKGIATNKLIAIVLISVTVVLGILLFLKYVTYSITSDHPPLSGPQVVLKSDNTVTLKFLYGSGTISAGDWQYSAWRPKTLSTPETQLVPWTLGQAPIASGTEVELLACTTAAKNGILNENDEVRIKSSGLEYRISIMSY